MKHKSERVLTTHTGSLPRPAELLGLVYARAHDRHVDEQAFVSRLEHAVVNIVRRQHAAGVDIVSDGEMSKPSYATYVTERLTGFEAGGRMPMPADLTDFPEYAERLLRRSGARSLSTPVCTSAIRYVGADKLERDLSNFRRALVDSPAAEAFMTAASPGVIAFFLANEYYPSHEAYLEALADGDAGRIRGDPSTPASCCRSTAPTWRWAAHSQFPDARRRASSAASSQLHVEALNQATANIPPERHAPAPLLGQLRRPAPPRRRAGATSSTSSCTARPQASPSKAPTRATSTSGRSVRAREAAGGQGAVPRRHRLDDQLHRAPGAGRAAHPALRRARRPRERHRRRRTAASAPSCGSHTVDPRSPGPSSARWWRAPGSPARRYGSDIPVPRSRDRKRYACTEGRWTRAPGCANTNIGGAESRLDQPSAESGHVGAPQHQRAVDAGGADVAGESEPDDRAVAQIRPSAAHRRRANASSSSAALWRRRR